MKLAFIGGGNMAHALITGLHSQQFSMSNITVIERDVEKCQHLQHQFGVQTSTALSDAANSEIIVLAIKPQQISALAKMLVPLLKNQLIISIAAGILLKDLSRWLDNYKNIVRAMPNTPAQIQSGITGLYAMPSVSKIHISDADQILSAVGTTIWLDDEGELDAVTAISGSGPAYVFYFIEALQEAALTLGLNQDQAKQLSLATFKGASLLADTSETSVDTLRKQVTSKGGTTEQGLLSLDESAVKDAIILAAEKAFNRAKSLGDELGNELGNK